MKNPIKQYFLFFSRAPFTFSLLIFFIEAIAAIIYLGLDEEAANIFIIKYAWIFIAITFGNMCLVYFIKFNYITDDDSDRAPIRLFSVLVTKDNEKIIITEPIWKTGVKYIITRENFDLSINLREYNYDLKVEELNGTTKTYCSITGKYKNSLVKVPVILTLKYDGAFDKIELFDMLVKNCSPWERCGCIITTKELSLNDYLKVAFKKANERNQPKFDEIISRYAQLLISDAEFLNELLDVVEFPERLFSCVVDTKICLDNPETSACKGVMCEK
jgi:hypothetical protein